MAIPESIKQKANKIRNEVYGKDVREALASGIEEAGDIADQANTQVDNIQAQVNQLVVEGDSSVEAAQARVDAEGKSYPTLKARLDEKETQLSSQLAQTDDKIYRLNIDKLSKSEANIIRNENNTLVQAYLIELDAIRTIINNNYAESIDEGISTGLVE